MLDSGRCELRARRLTSVLVEVSSKICVLLAKQWAARRVSAAH